MHTKICVTKADIIEKEMWNIKTLKCIKGDWVSDWSEWRWYFTACYFVGSKWLVTEFFLNLNHMFKLELKNSMNISKFWSFWYTWEFVWLWHISYSSLSIIKNNLLLRIGMWMELALLNFCIVFCVPLIYMYIYIYLLL
jgi:hypothetical protein